MSRWEPRQKTCGMWTTKGKCGRCANCVADEWSKTWHSLHEMDRRWVVAQYLVCGPLDYTEREAEWDARPSLGRYVLR